MLLQYLDGLYEYAEILTCNDMEAEDLVEETYLRAAEAYEQQPPDDLQLWLLTILRDAFRNRFGNVGRKPAMKEVHLSEFAFYRYKEKCVESMSFHADEARSADVRKAIRLLPEELRELIVLRDLRELSYSEIAGVLKCSIEMVQSSLPLARNKLSQLLASGWDQ
jgi:RNA polymerase sigma-70 factor (ECF subfamily)